MPNGRAVVSCDSLEVSIKRDLTPTPSLFRHHACTEKEEEVPARG